MKLSRLVYLAVKNVVYLDNQGFTYEAFISGAYDDDIDYSTSINNVFIPLNKAIHRLSDRGKLPTYSHELPKQSTGDYDLKNIKNDINEIKNVYYFDPYYGYERVDFRTVGADKLVVLKPSNKKLYIEYVKDIPHFDRDSFNYDENGNEVVDVNLKDYGITDTMCSYIIEYVKGNLLELIDPSLAMVYLNRAEEYMADLRNYQTYFNQVHIKKVV